MPVEQRVLGIDPGLGRVGVAIITSRGAALSLLTATTIQTQVKAPAEERFLQIQKELQALIKKFQPTRGAIEKLFFQKNISTAMAVAEARGIIRLTCAAAGLSLLELTPTEVKRTITGHGVASKPAMEKMVKLILKIPSLPRDDDAADAIALAICASLRSTYA